MGGVKVVVVGAGAMGAAMGAMLAKGGADVTLVDINADHMATIARSGLTIVGGPDGDETIELEATADPTTVTPADMVLVMTKSWATTDAVASVAHAVDPGTWVASAQNGMGNDDRIAEVIDRRQVLAGTTTVGATYLEPGVVEVSGTVTSGTSLTQFGLPPSVSSTPPDLQAIADAFSAAGLRTEVLPDANVVLWSKLAMAGTAGCLTAAAQISIADMYASSDAMRTWRAMFDELIAVATAEGVGLDVDEVEERALTTYRTVGPHWASMAVDIRERRRTEVDAMCGEVSRRGRRHGIATPVNDTIGDLIHAIEQSWGDTS